VVYKGEKKKDQRKSRNVANEACLKDRHAPRKGNLKKKKKKKRETHYIIVKAGRKSGGRKEIRGSMIPRKKLIKKKLRGKGNRPKKKGERVVSRPAVSSKERPGNDLG